MSFSDAYSDIDIEEAKGETKVFAGFALFCLLLFLLLDDFAFKALSMLGLAYSGFVFSLHGLTVVASKLSSTANRYFQTAIAIFFPLILSCKFIKDAIDPSIESLLTNLSPTLVVYALIISSISFAAGKEGIDIKYPFRGYIISAAVLFVLSWMRSGGTTGGVDLDGDSFTYLDPKKAKEFAEAGVIFSQYWLYVSASYLGLFFGFIKRLRRIKH